jgi:hypothetical protein
VLLGPELYGLAGRREQRRLPETAKKNPTCHTFLGKTARGDEGVSEIMDLRQPIVNTGGLWQKGLLNFCN